MISVSVNQYMHGNLSEGPGPVPVAPGPGPVPGDNIETVLRSVNQYMPLIEEITGIKRHELFLPVAKAVVTGKFEGLLDKIGAGKSSGPVVPEMRFIKIGKFVVLWGSLAVFLFGSAIIGLLALSKLLLVSL